MFYLVRDGYKFDFVLVTIQTAKSYCYKNYFMQHNGAIYEARRV